MSIKLKEVLRELSDKIAEVYNLELAGEMTNIYIDLVTRADDVSRKYWKLVKTLAVIEKERDGLRKKLEEERVTNESKTKSFNIATETAKEMIDKERELRDKAERERDQAEYDREYYAMQLMEYID